MCGRGFCVNSNKRYIINVFIEIFGIKFIKKREFKEFLKGIWIRWGKILVDLCRFLRIDVIRCKLRCSLGESIIRRWSCDWGI